MVRPLVQISPYLIRATIAAEDQRFGKHPGVDPVAILRAVGQNLQRAEFFGSLHPCHAGSKNAVKPAPRICRENRAGNPGGTPVHAGER